MIVVEGSTEGSCTADPFLEAREGVAMFSGVDFSAEVWEGMIGGQGRPYGEGPESVGSSSGNETPSRVPHQPKHTSRELVMYSSSGFRCHVAEVGQEELEPSIGSWEE